MAKLFIVVALLAAATCGALAKSLDPIVSGEAKALQQAINSLTPSESQLVRDLTIATIHRQFGDAGATASTRISHRFLSDLDLTDVGNVGLDWKAKYERAATEEAVEGYLIDPCRSVVNKLSEAATACEENEIEGAIEGIVYNKICQLVISTPHLYTKLRDPEVQQDEVSEVAPLEIEPAAIDTPAFETPVVETPVFEAPTVEIPAVETPAFEVPAVETPVVETPAVETPAVHAL